MPDDAAFCPGCGRPMRPVERATGKVGALPENIAGALAYFLIPAIIFLLVEPYSRNRFVRFHSFQCIAVYVAAATVGAVLRILGFVMFFIPLVGPLIVGLVSMIVGLAWFILWVVLVLKALQGETFKLPIAGDFAGRQAGV
jgi:uncharacterized membrane protein